MILCWNNVAGKQKVLGCFILNCPILFLPYFKQIDFHRSPQYHISQKTIQWKPRWYKRTDMTKVSSTFRDYAKTPETTIYLNSDLITLLATPKKRNEICTSVFCRSLIWLTLESVRLTTYQADVSIIIQTRIREVLSLNLDQDADSHDSLLKLYFLVALHKCTDVISEHGRYLLNYFHFTFQQ